VFFPYRNTDLVHINIRKYKRYIGGKFHVGCRITIHYHVRVVNILLPCFSTMNWWWRHYYISVQWVSVQLKVFSFGANTQMFCLQFSNLVESVFRGHSAALVAGGLDSSVGIMPLFPPGAVQNNLASGERLAGLGDPMVPPPAIFGGLSRAEGPIHLSDRGLLYRWQNLSAILFSTAH
jgi:hypothetical protein